MNEGAWISTGVLLGLLGVFGALYLRLLLIIKERTNQAINLVKRQKILLMDRAANFFGQYSKGMGQVRGNGVLILTDKGLFFEMWIPHRSFKIPLTSIIKAEKVRSFLGKTKRRDLVKIVFFNDKGIEDSAVWLVKSPEDWIFRINKLLKDF